MRAVYAPLFGRVAAAVALCLVLTRVVFGLPFGLWMDGDPPAITDLRTMLSAVADSDGETIPLNATAEEAVTDALRAAPLSSLPLFGSVFLLGAAQEPAYAEALRRNKRSVEARRTRIARFVEENDAAAAVREIALLLRIDRSDEGTYFDLLASIAQTTEGRAPVTAALAVRPEWREPLLTRLNRQSADLSFLYALNRDFPGWEASLITRLQEAGRYDLGFVAWLDLGGIDPASLQWPRDAQFAGTPGVAPFVWTLGAEQAEFAEEEGGLYIVHFGKQDQLFASQLMALGPGGYRVDLDAEGAVPAFGTGVLLRLICAKTGAVLTNAPFTKGPRDGAVRVATEITVPPKDCNFQRLSIEGRQTEIARIVRLRLDRIRITPQEASSRRANAAGGEG